MGAIMLHLHPTALKNPTADIRYLIPERIATSSIIEDGFDCLEEGKAAVLCLFFRTDHLDESVGTIKEIFQNETFWTMMCPPPRKSLFLRREETCSFPIHSRGWVPSPRCLFATVDIFCL